MSFTIRRVRILEDGEWKEKDIKVEKGLISSITSPTEKPGEGMNAEGLTALPGLIDVHVHLNEPGRAEWEGMASGTKALAAGGVTTFFDMPLNSFPPTADAERLKEKEQIAEEKSLIHSRFWGALMPDSLNEIEAMHKAGAVGFKAFMSRAGTEDFQHADDSVLLEGMERIAKTGSLLAVHAESDAFINWLTSRALKEGRESMQDYEKTRPVEAEVEAVERILLYAEWTKCRVHICHISSGGAADAVRRAKKKGIQVTAETCPHYLYFSLEDAARIGPLAKCAPPLRHEKEKEKLWQALVDGTLDLVSSDHSPAPAPLRKGTVLKAWGGIAGAQQTLDVLLTEGVKKRGVSMEQIISWTSSAPADIFRLGEKKKLEAGSDADITLVDLNETWTLKESDLYQKHKESPYIGETFTGRVKWTMAGGKIVHNDVMEGERV
jgi:allantoinase